MFILINIVHMHKFEGCFLCFMMYTVNFALKMG